MTPPRALISGSTGYIGSHLIQHLRSSGWAVAALVRPSSERQTISDLSRDEIHEISGTYRSLVGALEAVQPDVVFHLAAVAAPNSESDAVAELVQSNILFGTQLVDAMTKVGVTRLVNTGTGWQHYGNSSYSPVNLYAATKEAFDSVLQFYFEAHGLGIVTLKLNDTYGPDDHRPKVLNQLRKCAERGSTLAMTDGFQKIDLVHVSDVAEAFRLAAMRLKSRPDILREEYCVTSGQAISLRRLVELCCEAWDTDIEVQWGRKKYRAREVMNPWFGPTLPGWAPRIPLKVGLRALRTEADDGEVHENV